MRKRKERNHQIRIEKVMDLKVPNHLIMQALIISDSQMQALILLMEQNNLLQQAKMEALRRAKIKITRRKHLNLLREIVFQV